MKDRLTAWLSAATLALSAWTLYEVHSLRVDVAVLQNEQHDLARRVERIEHWGR